MQDIQAITGTVVWLAFAIGAAFGFVGGRTRFCTMGAVSDVVLMGEWGRMRMWMLAIATAVAGSAALQFAGLFDASKTIYTGNRLAWLSHVAGGAAFGVGMTLASGCGARTLIRLGGGNLKSVVVFAFFAISALMTMRGLFAVGRVRLLDTAAITLPHGQDIPAFLAAAGLAPDTALALAAGTVAIVLFAAALHRREAWCTDILLGGFATGALVVAGWYVTGHLGHLAEHPDTLEEAFLATNSNRAESLTFVAPLAHALDLLMAWSDASRVVTFGIASALGVVAGAALHAATSRSFRIESFHGAGDLARHIAGAVLMGFGGVTALGCTIGQGISGLSTLALGSVLTTASIILGACASLKLQYRAARRTG
ncbi:YeeE/YedE family protein [Thauera sinica]|uniref:YeeE/YedE family protein n=1 Tax=Thauera sinica TaxID=2665146 RepID=A0ABW1AT40_9RHOO|nr:YeeE/YedE family protein [Thauera sp. K11]ATE61323.1 transporter [Thauera sp. K11]